ncbi:NAD-dependent SIR2 family protein deacetylase [Actinomycetospora cinnamomea]|uniref:NAD-dependent protein deacetylase n=2 Tax=Actinomycetospora cinnamomea TaxID=663609 RepID=A0A2U1FFY1_9PSEU|nr:NAD-dependent SIR2 family protein deacetylase [Actinomycetospora cinnamomea]
METVVRSVMRYTAPQEAWEAPEGTVPVHGDVAALATLLAEGGALVLTGAGISTDSGIPDYRGPTSAARRHAPMTYEAFVGDPVARHRYWARSHVGWPQIAGARPNAGHRAVASLQRAGLVRGLITQNVDGLHQAAGARDVVELHGALGRVVCLGCREVHARGRIQDRLTTLNPGFGARAAAINPDGDAELADAELDRFTMAACPACADGPLKPDVVFFGESVPRPRVDHCFDLVDRARSLVVLGSSLTVMSGLRFVHAAVRRGLPVAVATAGPSRADAAATIRLTDQLGLVLPAVLDTLGLADRA